MSTTSKKSRELDPEKIKARPSWEHWFGNASFGQDVFSRVVIGGRISLVVAAAVTAIGMVVGGAMGLLAGYLLWSGKVEESPKAIVIIEQILSRQLGPEARQIVAAAAALGDEPLVEGDAPADPAAGAASSDA